MPLYTVSLEDNTPGPRYDGLPWVNARVEQSATRDGVFVPVETFALSPLDTNPALPQSRDFTTNNATLSSAWFRVAFVDAQLAEQLSAPVYFPNPGGRPTVQEVATLLQARTRDRAGVEVGTFTTLTRTTPAQAELVIDQALADVQMRTGTVVPDALNDAARHVVAIRAAMLIESSYMPEQTGEDNTVYINFRFQYAEQIGLLVTAVQLRCLFPGDNRFDPLTGALIV